MYIKFAVTQLCVIKCVFVQEKLVFEAFSYGNDTSYSLYMGDEVSPENIGDKEHFKHSLVNKWGKEIDVYKVS